MLALPLQPGGLAALLFLQSLELPALRIQFTVNAMQYPTGFADLVFNIMQALFSVTFLSLIGFQLLLQGLDQGTQVIQLARFFCATLCSNNARRQQQGAAEQNSDPTQAESLRRTAWSRKSDQASTPGGGAESVSECSGSNSINDRPVICVGGSSPIK